MGFHARTWRYDMHTSQECSHRKAHILELEDLLNIGHLQV